MYWLTQDYITEKFCVNKDKPELQCNGKCYLTKELAKASENDNPLSENKKNTNSKIEILFISEISDYSFNQNYCELNKTINTFYSNLYKWLFTNSTFHPPNFIV